MKRPPTFLIVLLLLAGFVLFHLLVTPWGELPGRLVFKTNRLPLSDEGNTVTMIRYRKSNHTVYKGGGLYDCRWSPDGKQFVAFTDKNISVFDDRGNVINSITMLEEMLGRDIAWFPDGRRVLTVESDIGKGVRKGHEPNDLYLYDFSTGERTPFYTKGDFAFFDIEISKAGEIFFTGKLSGENHREEKIKLHRMDSNTKKVTPTRRTALRLRLIHNDTKIVFFGAFRIFGQLISPQTLGIYDLKTGFTRYLTLFGGDVQSMTAIQDGRYLVTSEGKGDAVILYKRSLLGGFKLPIMKPEWLEHIGTGFPSQDEYPDWHA